MLRSGARSVKRISERDATRSREGLALKVLLVLGVDATEVVVEDAMEGTRLSTFERPIDCFRVVLSLGCPGPSS